MVRVPSLVKIGPGGQRNSINRGAGNTEKRSVQEERKEKTGDFNGTIK